MTMPQDPRQRPGDRDHRLHDVDLVAAYAGDDPGINREAAAALVAACPDCRSEFSLQREVAMWMSGAPVVTLDLDERTLLHDRVGIAIAGSAVVSLTERRSRRQPGQILFRIASAAAAVAVVAGLGGVFGGVGGDNDGGDSLQTVAAELSADAEEGATTAAAAEATTTLALPYAAGGSVERAMLPGGDAEVVEREIEELIAQAVDANAAAGVPEDAQADEMTAIPPCASAVEDREVLLTAESMLEGEPIIVFVVGPDVAAGTSPDSAAAPEALVFKIADCSVVDLG